ncbi:MAG: hypothetical protein ACT4PY_09395 [Armatimonadota bacterium]
MARARRGFWSREDVQAILARHVRGEVTLDEAAGGIQALGEKDGVTKSIDELREDVKYYAPGVHRKLGLLPPAKTQGVTVRLSRAAMESFKDLARRTSRSLGSVVGEAAEEALRMRQHPGIVFAGPVGDRRARLEGGPDVWEVVAVHLEGGEDKARTLRVLTHLIPGQLDVALQYSHAHSEEIDRLIAENERPIDEWQRLYPHLAPGPPTTV